MQEATMCRIRLLLPPVLVILTTSTIQAITIHVPADQPTIQAGINAAIDGDTVLVADGRYTGSGNRDIEFRGKAIVVMSENGPGNCIIDCQASGSTMHHGFRFINSYETNASVVQGFTIINAVEVGGAIRLVNSSPTIRGNVMTGNNGG
jgi:hypothetical protein